MNDIDMYSGGMDFTELSDIEEDEEEDDLEDYYVISKTAMLHPNTPHSIKRLFIIHHIFIMDRIHHLKLIGLL